MRRGLEWKGVCKPIDRIGLVLESSKIGWKVEGSSSGCGR